MHMHMHMLAFSYLIEQKLLCFGAMFCSNVLTVLQECCIWRPVLGSGIREAELQGHLLEMMVQLQLVQLQGGRWGGMV